MKKFIFLAVSAALFSSSITSANSTEDYSSLFQPVTRGDQSSQSTYFLLTDRFADGDKSNNVDGYDPTDIGYWHGGDFKGLSTRLEYIKSMGFTSIWITPPFVQQSIQGSSAAYHGYWALDFMHVDPHLGGDSAFTDFINAAHKLGLKVIMDVVANHTADVISYDANGKAFIPIGKESVKNPQFLNQLTNYHNLGESTFQGNSTLTGDFYGLDDIKTENSEVVQGFINIWSYWIREFNIDGFRIDTFRHVNPEFWRKVIPAIKKVAKDSGKDEFPIYGEVADSDPRILSSYVVSEQAPSVLDFGFNEQVTRYIAMFGRAEALAEFFNSDDFYTSAHSSAYGLATFLGNHDMGRIGLTILNNASNETEALRMDLMAQAALLLLRGGPIFYYGDEHGMTGAGGDKLARHDFFQTSITRWKIEKRIGESPIGEKSSFDTSNPILSEIKKLQRIISTNNGLRVGTQQVSYAADQVFIVTRFFEGQEYVVAFNAAEEKRKIQFKPISTTGSWEVIAGKCSAKTNIVLTLEANQYCLLKNSKTIGKARTTEVSAPLVQRSADQPLLKQISVKVNSPGYNEVAFLGRQGGTEWKYLGTSDRTTFKSRMINGGQYRIYLQKGEFSKNAVIEFIAIVKNSDGKIFSSSITKGVNN